MDKIKSIIEKIEKNNLFVFLSFFLIALIIFSPSLFNLNFFWDDERFVFLNPQFMNSPSWTYFWNIRSDMFKVWPFGYTMFWFALKAFPTNTLLALKVFNIIFHSFNAFLVFKVFKKIKAPISFLLALIFLVHPLNVENVSWMFQFLTISSFTFFIASFYFFLNFLDDQKKRMISATFILFALSLLTKGIALLAPFLFLSFFIYKKIKIKNYLYLIPFFMLSLFLGLLTQKGTEDITNSESSIISKTISDFFNLSQKEMATGKEETVNKDYADFIFMAHKKTDEIIFNKSEVLSQSLLHYPFKMLIPVNLHFLYKPLKIPLIYAFSFIFLGLGFTGYLFKKTKDANLIATAFYSFIFILPYLGITFITFFYWSNVSDRYTYYVIPGFVLFLGITVNYFWSHLSYRIIGTYTTLLIALTVSYSLQFNNPLKLYEDTIKQKEHPVTYSLLFEQYFYKLDLINGERILLEGVKKFPKDQLLQGDLVRLESLKKFYK